MGRYADAAESIEAKAGLIEEQMPAFAAGVRRAATIIRNCDKYAQQ